MPALRADFPEEWEREIDFAPGGQIEVDLPAGQLQIRGWDRPLVALSSLPGERSAASPGAARVTNDAGSVGDPFPGNDSTSPGAPPLARRPLNPADEKQSRLALNLARNSRRLRIESSRRGFLGRAGSVSLELAVPRSTNLSIDGGTLAIALNQLEGDIKIDTAAGDITISDLSGSLDIDSGQSQVSLHKIDGNVRIDLGGGGVQARVISGELLVDTGGANILGEILLGGAKIDAGAGQVVLSDLQGPLDVDMAGGSIQIKRAAGSSIKVDAGPATISAGFLCRPGGRYRFENSHGDIQLNIDPGEGFELDLESSRGWVETDFELKTTTLERSELAGTFGQPVAAIRAKSASGRIVVRPQRAGEDLPPVPLEWEQPGSPAPPEVYPAGRSGQVKTAAGQGISPPGSERGELEVLELLAQGKLSPEEAETLLERLKVDSH
ncbi:MAG: DUF4097 family beta strand repeat-containing protein [Firmicutes bacterium]|nr:DUF4097 family beta strand repeat-containing protein [Bacillota bacterium]MCL5039871.1 DUF4097 family beta strand repeat-containing protein [Bacillota bacterium]